MKNIIFTLITLLSLQLTAQILHNDNVIINSGDPQLTLVAQSAWSPYSRIAFNDWDNNLVASMGVDLTGGSFTYQSIQGSNMNRVIYANLNVNIGTELYYPDYKLSVNGKIRAKEVRVETGWADFVFFEDYKLPTLQEVEAHINEKGHLKDIPNAKEVEENGVFLGEISSKLLQKIEELTLYTINQEKKINELTKKMIVLETQLKK